MPREIHVLTHEFAPVRGGIAVYVEETVRAAAKLGWKITVWAPGPKRTTRQLTWGTLQSLPLVGNQNWPDRLKLRYHLLKAAIDWSQTLLWLPEPGPIRLWMYADWLNLPQPAELVLTLHGSEILRLQSPRYRRNRLQQLINRSNRVGVVSTFVENLLHMNFQISPGQTVRVPGALRHDFQVTPESPTPSAGPPWRILTVARIHPRKGQDQMLKALALLPPTLRAQVLYIAAGPHRTSSYLADLRRFAQEHNIQLELPGCLPDHDLPALYQSCHLFAFTPIHQPLSVEGLGLVCLEAAAAGLPIIAHATGGVPEAVEHLHNGLLVQPGDAPALAKAIEALLTTPHLRHQLAAASPSVAQRFDWNRNARLLFGAPTLTSQTA